MCKSGHLDRLPNWEPFCICYTIKVMKKFPEGFYWGEKVWETFARPCQLFLEFTRRNNDTVYSLGKRGNLLAA